MKPRFVLAALVVALFAHAPGLTQYSQVQDEGSNLASQTTINFVGRPITCANDTDRTTCTVSTPVIFVDDYGAKGDGVADDTQPWQDAIAAASLGESGLFLMGTVVGRGTANYRITDTIKIREARNGIVDGNGARFMWDGPSGVPMWLLEDTEQVRIQNMYIWVDVDEELNAAFELRNPGGACNSVAPNGNILEGIIVTAVWDGLDYGVRFTQPLGEEACNDCPSGLTACLNVNNDVARIIRSGFFNYKEAAISIEHSQSTWHQLIDVQWSSAVYPQAPPASKFVNLKKGSFQSFGTSGSGATDTDFYIEDPNVGIVIQNANSENSNRFIRTLDLVASDAPQPLRIIGGRFSVNKLAGDGKFIDWNRAGPLLIDGLMVEGSYPGSNSPRLHFDPDLIFGDESMLQVTGCHFLWPLADTHDIIQLGPKARLVAHSNTCHHGTFGVDDRTASCTGLAAGIYANSSVTFAKLGAMRDGHFVFCSDCKRNTAPCEGGGTGTMAARTGGAWHCGGFPGSVVFELEGQTIDDNETSLQVVDPTADRTIKLPNANGTLVVTGSSSTLHGVARWGSADPAFDTGDEVCAEAGLTCVTTYNMGTPFATACNATHAQRYLAFCN